MITQRTVLILGAGASMPYRFPSGRGLLDLICQQLEGGAQSPFGRDLQDCGVERSDIERFRTDLYLSQKHSVDAFLEHRPELMGVGKVAIARALIPFEDGHRLMAMSRQSPETAKTSPWYDYLFNRLACMREDFRGNKLTVLTYNYDRSIEQFLYTAVKHSYDLSDEEVTGLLQPVRVIHLHGHLGAHPSYAKDSDWARTYDIDLRPDTLTKCAANLRIMHEEITESAEFQQAMDALSFAKRVCFLGFGFDPVNVGRLELPDNTSTHYWGTVYGLRQAEIETVRGYFSKLSSRQLHLGDPNHDCLTFLRTFPILS